MTDFQLVWTSLLSRPLNNLLSVLLTAFGVMLAVMILMLGHHVQNRLGADGKGVDLVVGAKGSPLQLILSSVYHIDIPTGNIPYAEAEKWMRHPKITSAIPLALGDNWKGFRIVGTTPDYIHHYNATLKDGHIWTHSFEAVAGSATGLQTGMEFSGAHGLASGGHDHENEKYKITGTLNPTGTVLDRLILTSVDSVLKIHGQEEVEHHHLENHHEEEHENPAEITALLLKVKSPIDMMNLPRMINRETSLMAANPALEITRLTAMMGLGTKTFAIITGFLITISCLSIFSGLAGNFENRMNDLAVLRALGFTRKRLFKLTLSEGAIITLGGVLFGLLFSFTGFTLLSNILSPLKASGANPDLWTQDILATCFCVFLAGIFSAMLPAMRAAKIDAAPQLAKGI